MTRPQELVVLSNQRVATAAPRRVPSVSASSPAAVTRRAPLPVRSDARRPPRLHPLAVAIALVALGATASRSRGQVMDDSLSIFECARMARDAAPGVRASALDLRAARLDSTATWRNRRPAFSLFGNATVAPSGSYDPVVTDLGHYEIKAGVEVPLLDGGERARARARASNEAVIAALELERARRDAAVRAGGLAIEALRLAETESFQRQSLEWLAGLASVIESGVRAGAHGRADALRLALERDGVQAALQSTATDAGVALRELAQLLGRPDAPPRVRPPGSDDERPPADEDSIKVVDRLERLPELAAARAEEVGRALDLGDQRARSAVRVDASADAGLAGADLTRVVPPDLAASHPGATLADRLRQDRGASATVELKLPIADASLAPAAEARRVGLEAATLRRAAETDTQRRIGLDLLARWRESSQRLSAARVTVERADASLIRMKSLYVAGAAGLLDLLDARRTLDEAHERLADARAGSRAARLEVELRP